MQLTFAISDEVSYECREDVLSIVIVRPAKRNALSLGVLQRLENIFSDHVSSPDVKLAILTGEGDRAFASGGDLVELADLRSVYDARALSLHGKAALNAIRRFPVPVIARINGVALGGGAELAVACDMRFASAHASIGFVHGRLAISPSWGGGVDLMQLVGYGTATRLLARAEVLNARQALDVGLFDGVAPE